MKNFKKALALVLSLVLILGAMPFAMVASAEFEAGDTYSVSIGEANYELYTQSSDVALSYGYRQDNMRAPYYTFSINKGQSGSVIYKFNDFGGTSIKDLSIAWYGRMASGSGQYIGCYVSTDGQNWTFVNAIARDKKYTKLTDGEEIAVADRVDPGYGKPVVDLKSLGTVDCLYVKMHVKNETGGTPNHYYYANLTVSGTYVGKPEEKPYSAAFGNDFYDETNTENNYFGTHVANIIESDGVQGGNVTNYGEILMPKTPNTASYAIFKFDVTQEERVITVYKEYKNVDVVEKSRAFLVEGKLYIVKRDGLIIDDWS